MQHYNFALIFVGFQRCCIFLTIVKELSKTHKVAIFPQELDEKTSSRIENTNKSFLELCESYGADIIYSQKITADIEILPQTHYTQNAINFINKNIVSQKTFWLSGIAMGNAQYEYLHEKKIDKILVVDRQFYDFRVQQFEKEKKPKFEDDKIIEIGVPYKKYPIFPSLEIDYLIANPTPFSFCNSHDRLAYLENVLLILGKIDDRKVIALKPHNADERTDYIVNSKIYSLISFRLLVGAHSYIDECARFFSSLFSNWKISDLFLQVSIAIKYHLIMRRAKSLEEFTNWHNFNLELFLPSVKEGLITGRSNSIWHGLFLKKPTYNCIDEDKPYFSDTKMHKFSMEYLSVHGNYKNIQFNNRLYGKITNQTRDIDIVEILKNELKTISINL